MKTGPLRGRTIRVNFIENLCVNRGKIRSGEGRPVHAGSNIPKRRITLDRELLDSPAELRRILIHEIFHFTWVRLGNPRRWSWEELLRAEFGRGVRGELGWSAEGRKARLSAAQVNERSRLWREYVCESFCDTAAWLFAGLKHHDEFTLGQHCRKIRRGWFNRELAGRCLPI